MSAPTPDLHPQVAPPAPGSECCDCCAGVGQDTPRPLANRDGLSAIAYRIGDHQHFRASLLAALSSSAFAPLAGLRTRDPDDFTIGLIDAFACSADVLTFYQERIASESWLRTAVERVSLQEMGKLVGYRLRPGVAAETWLAFALETPPAPPPALAPEPGNFVTGVPASLALDIGTRVQSVPGPGEQPQTFELVEPIAEARPGWSAVRPWLAEVHYPLFGEREAWLAGTATGLKAGDALLFVGQDFFTSDQTNHWDFRLLSTVEADDANGRTRVTWPRGLGSSDPHSDPARQPVVFALRKRAGVFGNNAPVWAAMNADFRTGYVKAVDAGTDAVAAVEWPFFTISRVTATASGGAVDLDGVQGEVSADVATALSRRSFAVLARGSFNRPDEGMASDAYVELYRVTGVGDLSRAEFAVSTKVTRLSLSGQNLDTNFARKVRETSVFTKTELLALAARPVADAVAGTMIPANVAADGLLPGRRLLVRGRLVADGTLATVPVTLVAAHPVDAGRATLEVSPAVPALIRGSVVIYANVGLASHGESGAQLLGSGNAALPFAQFELKQTPLTFRATDDESGTAAELTLRVNDIAWEGRRTLYSAVPTDRAYALTIDEQGRQFVTFGDGVRGARLPSGTNNVQARYRKGIGVAGNVAADRLTLLLSRPLGLKSVSNPLPAEGGTDPEPPAAARETIPLTTRTLDRAVSLLDYEDFARAYAGIAKAQAAVLHLRAGPTVAVTLAAAEGAAIGPTSPTWQHLDAALRKSGDPHVALVLLAAQQSNFGIGIRVKPDPAYDAKAVLAAVEAALRDAFSFARRALGEPVQQSAVIAVAQAVPGVVAVDLTALYGGTRPAAQTARSLQVRLLATRMHVEGGAPRPAELLVLDPAPLDLLEVMP